MQYIQRLWNTSPECMDPPKRELSEEEKSRSNEMARIKAATSFPFTLIASFFLVLLLAPAEISFGAFLLLSLGLTAVVTTIVFLVSRSIFRNKMRDPVDNSRGGRAAGQPRPTSAPTTSPKPSKAKTRTSGSSSTSKFSQTTPKFSQQSELEKIQEEALRLKKNTHDSSINNRISELTNQFSKKVENLKLNEEEKRQKNHEEGVRRAFDEPKQMLKRQKQIIENFNRFDDMLQQKQEIFQNCKKFNKEIGSIELDDGAQEYSDDFQKSQSEFYWSFDRELNKRASNINEKNLEIMNFLNQGSIEPKPQNAFDDFRNTLKKETKAHLDAQPKVKDDLITQLIHKQNELKIKLPGNQSWEEAVDTMIKGQIMCYTSLFKWDKQCWEAMTSIYFPES